MKHQDLFSLKTKKKYFGMASAAVDMVRVNVKNRQSPKNL